MHVLVEVRGCIFPPFVFSPPQPFDPISRRHGNMVPFPEWNDAMQVTCGEALDSSKNIEDQTDTPKAAVALAGCPVPWIRTPLAACNRGGFGMRSFKNGCSLVQDGVVGYHLEHVLLCFLREPGAAMM